VTRLRVYGTERALVRDVELRVVDEMVFMDKLRCRGAIAVCKVMLVVGRDASELKQSIGTDQTNIRHALRSRESWTRRDVA
jgi:hypothetical protein